MCAFTALDDERRFFHKIKINEYCPATLYHSKIVSTTKIRTQQHAVEKKDVHWQLLLFLLAAIVLSSGLAI